MDLLFIDESGDCGVIEGSSDYYILAGLSIEDISWKEFFWQIQETRKLIVQQFALTFQEFKGSDLFSHRGPFFNTSLGPRDLSQVYEHLIHLICDPKAQLFVSIIKKADFRSQFQEKDPTRLKKLLLESSWRSYLINYEKHIIDKSVLAGRPQTGIVYWDLDPGVEKIVRKMVRERARKLDRQALYPSAGIVDDLVCRDSHMSSFIQLADILASSIIRIVKGQSQNDAFKIDPEIAAKLKDKVRVDILPK